MRTSKCTVHVWYLARNAQKEFLIGQSSRSHATYRRPSLDAFKFLLCPQEGCKVLWWVCLSVCLSTCITQKLCCQTTKFFRMLPQYFDQARKSIRPVKKLSDGVLVWLSVWSVVQMICIWSRWCHCHPSPLASVKSRMVYLSGAGLPRLSWKKAIKRARVCVCVAVAQSSLMVLWYVLLVLQMTSYFHTMGSVCRIKHNVMFRIFRQVAVPVEHQTATVFVWVY